MARKRGGKYYFKFEDLTERGMTLEQLQEIHERLGQFIKEELPQENLING